MLFTVDQVAARLNVSAPTVWRYSRIFSDFPPKIRLSPGCTRWNATEIEAWLAAREERAA